MTEATAAEWTHVYRGDLAAFGVVILKRRADAAMVRIVATLTDASSPMTGQTVTVPPRRLTERPAGPERPTEERDGVTVDAYDRRPVRPTAPRTPAQRRAVATLVEHGRVWVQSRGRWAVSGTNGAEVSGAMSEWLQVNGWAHWDYGRPGAGAVLVVLTRGPGWHGVQAVPARAPYPGERPVYRCETCGRRWAEDTPAGRCPWEDVHPAE